MRRASSPLPPAGLIHFTETIEQIRGSGINSVLIGVGGGRWGGVCFSCQKRGAWPGSNKLFRVKLGPGGRAGGISFVAVKMVRESHREKGGFIAQKAPWDKSFTPPLMAQRILFPLIANL